MLLPLLQNLAVTFNRRAAGVGGGRLIPRYIWEEVEEAVKQDIAQKPAKRVRKVQRLKVQYPRATHIVEAAEEPLKPLYRAALRQVVRDYEEDDMEVLLLSL